MYKLSPGRKTQNLFDALLGGFFEVGQLLLLTGNWLQKRGILLFVIVNAKIS